MIGAFLDTAADPVLGADGARGGWLTVAWDLSSGRSVAALLPGLPELLALAPARSAIALDMPVGLLDRALPGGRACDRAARQRLGRPRASSVFSPPVRAALRAQSYADALAINRASSCHRLGLSKQCFHLFAKLREVDAVLSPAVQDRVFEAHSELAFQAMNDGQVLHPGKATPTGRKLRSDLLKSQGFLGIEAALESARRGSVKTDDILDGFALAWTAARIRCGDATRLPAVPPRDSRGLRMEIWG